jgi:predicted DsbA family dithiol-disulfide isomerase
MSDLKIEVFTGPRCPNCPHAVKATKKLLKDNPKLRERVKWVEVSTGTRRGQKRAQRYGIRSVPTIILTNKNGEKRGVRGTPSQDRYLDYVYQMLGEEVPENMVEKGEKKGFFERLFNRCMG